MTRKLKLSRETLRRLDATRLASVGGARWRSVEVPPIPTVDNLTCQQFCPTNGATCALTVCDVCGTDDCGVLG